MFKLIPPINSIGLELTSDSLKIATIKQVRGSPVIEDLQTIPLSQAVNVKQLYKQQPFLTTGVSGSEILLRVLQLPLTKEKDINESLVFQAEPLLPYPVDQALLTKQTLNKSAEGTELTLLSLKKEALKSHLDHLQQFQIDPEKVACLQAALCQFGKTYISPEKAIIIVHLQEEAMTCILIHAGKLLASFSRQEGLNLLYKAAEKDFPQEHVKDALKKLNFTSLIPDNHQHLKEALKRLQQNIAKMTHALIKESKGQPIDLIALSGEGIRLPNLNYSLLNNLPCTIWKEEEEPLQNHVSFEDKLCYAEAIGLAINSLPSQKEPIDFRLGEFSYAHPWKRIVKPLAAYFVCMLLLSLVFYFFSQDLLRLEQNEIKRNYVDLLAGMGKSYDQFETAFSAKNPAAAEMTQGDIIPIVHLNLDDLQERMNFLQKDIQSTPDTFPLFANVPRVSDVLAWLSQHPAVLSADEGGTPEQRLKLENLSYMMIKRPDLSKKQEKYQVKIELEFSTPIPKWAREFHDALITPNDFVDPKGEIKWNANRGKYKTSFYLKDKTSYL
jgi:type IV pilus assembly protein PilM